jgi:hypothetical protein
MAMARPSKSPLSMAGMTLALNPPVKSPKSIENEVEHYSDVSGTLYIAPNVRSTPGI